MNNDSPYDDPTFIAVNDVHEKERAAWPNGLWRCAALNCQPPCKCYPPVPPNHKPVS
jgi:hypothetical protein